jgi:simple sugar transport system permease protein
MLWGNVKEGSAMAILERKPGRLDLNQELVGSRRRIAHLLDKNRRALSALLVFAILMLLFVIAEPTVFLDTGVYEAIFTALPIRIVLVLPLVFVIASGEIDLSFVSTMTFGLWAFATTASAGWDPFLSALLAVSAGALIGLFNGLLVTRAGLSSMVTTLGMSFLLRGLVVGGTATIGIPLTFLKGTPFYSTFVGRIGGFPVQMVWALVSVLAAALLFNYHKFGSHVCCVGDNLESSREMGISVTRVKTLAFVYMGVAAGFAGVLYGLVYGVFFPRAGDPGELLLAVLASAFVGGTPTWGGVGTVIGAVFGALTIRFIETGVIEVGLTGFWTELFNGLIILLALVGHRLHEPRYRY